MIAKYGQIFLLIALMSIAATSCSENANQKPVAHAGTALTTELVASGLNRPVFVTAAPGDNERLYVVDQLGQIQIIKNGTVQTTPFLDLSDRVKALGNEQGLLGLAFHPEYPDSAYIFVNYTMAFDSTFVSRFNVTSADTADAFSEQVVLRQFQPYSNHNAGMLAFSPLDGYLYIGFGDGGAAGDPQNRAQNPTTFLGKMLRIDVADGLPYLIPPDNPFVGTVDTLPEIWAFGLRNPWRYSFDQANGDFYIGDVGQGAREEIDYQPYLSFGGENYGWRLKEGTLCYDPPGNCDTLVGLTDPIYEYDHAGAFCNSITGGYLYRGCAIPDLHGTYFFGGYCRQKIWSFRYDGVNLTEFTDRTAELGLSNPDVSSFGTDNQGEIYIVVLSGSIYKIVPDGVPSQCNLDCCQGIRGNSNGDPEDKLNISDVTYLVSYLFGVPIGPPPPCLAEGNSNGDPEDKINISDVTFLVTYLFGVPNGPEPPTCG